MRVRDDIGASEWTLHISAYTLAHAKVLYLGMLEEQQDGKVLGLGELPSWASSNSNISQNERYQVPRRITSSKDDLKIAKKIGLLEKAGFELCLQVKVLRTKESFSPLCSKDNISARDPLCPATGPFLR